MKTVVERKRKDLISKDAVLLEIYFKTNVILLNRGIFENKYI